MLLREILKRQKVLYVRQRFEAAEIFGFETRNKYQLEAEDGSVIGFAAEQQKGIGGFLFRQLLGHWRQFEILIFDINRAINFRAVHPFRFFFQRLEVLTADGRPIGALQQRFSLLTKRFDVEGTNGEVLMTVSSPIWRLWTFSFEKNGRKVALIQKKWSGILSEAFTDKDRFRIEMLDPSLGEGERSLLLTAAIFIDLQYFEDDKGPGFTSLANVLPD